ncbi:MAG: hypothetical protein A2735_03420 [Candidatus Yanofskybacteria bacterium RIFCSPHIGHO2_01_FULL_41_21]|uniref:Peptidase M16 n=1 Tax=Candidatus Yanofskybacteria bacterium RIFCSPHIGHO2_01_FULL_41_21 TaxID=1802660 RepID=A0A1F8EBA8_9BACT|nr:MAG: hypothetical protein A2735_03420 [Candidatus Yanofskybacteria bacterium RIFCSPHIGHO2_01_FULL_41_21]
MYKESTLENGLKVLTYEDKSIPVIDIKLVFKAGSRYEEIHQKGYAHILEHMLMKGTVKRPTPVLIAKEIDTKGGYKNAITNRESLSIVLQAADNYSEELFELLSDMLLNSLIDSTVLENEKKIIIEELKKADDNIESFFWRFTFEKLFNGHPLASNILGDPESIMSADDSKLRIYKDKFLVPDGAALIVSGNINHDKVVVLAQKYFSEWSGKLNTMPAIELKSAPQKPYFYTKDTKQTIVSYNFYTVPASKAREFLALDLIRFFLNFGGSSILNEELRHKRGLVYSTFLWNTRFSDAGLFAIKTSTTKPKETIKVIEDIVSNLKNLFTANLLEGIKARRIGAFKCHIANPYNQNIFLSEGFLDLGRLITPKEYITEISSISYDEILHVIDAYLVTEKAVITAIGPEDIAS